MVIKEFPPVSSADETGLIAIGGDLEVQSLVRAYREGIFPWPLSEGILTWFAPPQRALLYLQDFHLGKKLRKQERQSPFTFSINRHFDSVVHACAAITNRTQQSGTWITPEVIDGYIRLHEAGYAHSIEAYRDGRLVGGLYGVAINGMFAGESMFYREPNASKLALHYLVQYLQEKNVEWIDCQVMTPLLASLGAKEVPRETFMNLLKGALAEEIELLPVSGKSSS